MTPQTELLELIVKTAEENCNLDAEISLNELSDKNSLYAEFGTGYTETIYYDKSAIRVIPVLFLCRNSDQKRCVEQLCDICNYLQRLKEYPNCESAYWLDTVVAKEPSKVGRDEDGMYHYSCILNIKCYF